MELILKRTKFTEFYTTGQLYIEGDYFCFTLEGKVDQPRKEGDKIGKKQNTSIPTGLYKVSPNHLTLLDVPRFDKVYIHDGQYPSPNGSIIVGYKVTGYGLIMPRSTKSCIYDLKHKLRNVESCSIRVLN